MILAGAAGFQLPGESTYFSDSVELLGINQTGPAGILPPGYRGTITLSFLPDNRGARTVTNFTLSTIPSADTPFDWSSVESDLQPPDVPNDAWAADYQNFTAYYYLEKWRNFRHPDNSPFNPEELHKQNVANYPKAYRTGGSSQHLVNGDPNNLTGPAGFGTSGYITPTQTLPYTIAFANEPTADIPVQQVVVTDQLDSNLEWTTFQVGDFSIGGTVYQVPANDGFYSTQIPLTLPANQESTGPVSIELDVTAGINLTTGIATWTFTSVDPGTGDLLADIFTGFPPPDSDPPAGEAFVTYTVRPKPTDTTGILINAQASVVFDTNSPLATPQVTNAIDSAPPTSSVAAFPASSPPSFTVSWNGQDDPGGSGNGKSPGLRRRST